jgi:hypothetical protein
MRHRSRAFCLVAALALCGAARPARAFERQWHLGGGAGVTTANGYSLAPALSAYAAYGLSDMFDLRLELTGHGYGVADEARPTAASAMAGICYKLDVLRWVPWAGVYAGYRGFFEAPPAAGGFRRHDAAVALGLGVDYGVTRSLGLGVTLRYDQALASTDARSFDALLRAEYRWGW